MKKVTRYSRILALVCTMALLALTVAGCGQKTGSDQTSASNAEEAAKSEKTKEAESEGNAEKEQVSKESAQDAAEESAQDAAQEPQAQAESESETASSEAEALNAEELNTGDLGEALAAAQGSGDTSIDDLLVFASDTMGFSFLYDPRHIAYVGPTGAALVAIDGDKARTGLFVSVVDSENLPTPEEYFETEIFNLQQRYLNAMQTQPKLYDTEIDGHKIIGILYAYSAPTGGTIDCTEFIEVKGDKYVFYHTRAPREKSGPELNAMGLAMASLELDAGAYGKPDAVSGNLPKDEFDKDYVGSSGDSQAQGGALASAGAADFEGDYYFDTDESYLILADGDTTQVYTGGVMEGANFSVEKVELSESIGDTIVSRTKEVADMLSVRMIGQPEVKGIEIGDRRLAGFVTTYSAVDGTKTIVAEEFYEEIGGATYCWYAIYDKGDEVTPAAFEKAMETFTLK